MTDADALIVTGKKSLIRVSLRDGKTSPIWAPITGFRSGNPLSNHPVPECENKCLILTLFAKIRLYWALKTRVTKAL